MRPVSGSPGSSASAEPPPAYGRLAALGWDIDALGRNPAVRDRTLAVAPKALKRRYPARLFRYWFVHQFLRIELQRIDRGLRVCEVGIDKGQLLHFVRADGTRQDVVPLDIAQWIGVDIHVKHADLAPFGYTRLVETNIEQDVNWLRSDTDVVVLLHVLEHLFHPEPVLLKMAGQLRSGAAIVGGLPSLPAFLAPQRERKIRANPNANGHVSAFSPARIRSMARECGLELEFLSGAFFLRAGGLLLEDYGWWMRFNIAFGACIPDWPGETYWVLRKT